LRLGDSVSITAAKALRCGRPGMGALPPRRLPRTENNNGRAISSPAAADVAARP